MDLSIQSINNQKIADSNKNITKQTNYTSFKAHLPKEIEDIFMHSSSSERKGMLENISKMLGIPAAFIVSTFGLDKLKSADETPEIKKITPKTKKIDLNIRQGSVSVKGQKDISLKEFFDNNSVECTTQKNIDKIEEFTAMTPEEETVSLGFGRYETRPARYLYKNGEKIEKISKYDMIASEESYKNGKSELIDFSKENFPVHTQFKLKSIPFPSKFVLIEDDAQVNMKGTIYDLKPGTIICCKDCTIDNMKELYIMSPKEFLATYIPTVNDKSKELFEKVKKYSNVENIKQVSLQNHPYPELDKIIEEIESKIVSSKVENEHDRYFRVEYFYDKNGNKIKTNSNNYVQYDENNRLISNFCVEKDPKEKFVRYVTFLNKYTYDENGNQIRHAIIESNSQW